MKEITAKILERAGGLNPSQFAGMTTSEIDKCLAEFFGQNPADDGFPNADQIMAAVDDIREINAKSENF